MNRFVGVLSGLAMCVALQSVASAGVWTATDLVKNGDFSQGAGTNWVNIGTGSWNWTYDYSGTNVLIMQIVNDGTGTYSYQTISGLEANTNYKLVFSIYKGTNTPTGMAAVAPGTLNDAGVLSVTDKTSSVYNSLLGSVITTTLSFDSTTSAVEQALEFTTGSNTSATIIFSATTLGQDLKITNVSLMKSDVVPEAASLGLLAAAGPLMLYRRR